MRILFCVPERVTTKLGAPKVYVELASALEELGCTCEVIGIEEVAPGIRELDGKTAQNEYYSRRLRQYIIDRADEFDVVEYDHQALPYPRSDFPEDVVLVARSVLLAHHAKSLDFPTWRGIPVVFRNAVSQILDRERSHSERTDMEDYLVILKKHLGTAVRYRRERSGRRDRIDQATVTCQNADLVIVSNTQDRQALINEDVDVEKIVQLPFGLTESRFEALSSARTDSTTPPTVVFVGTFDFRKGGATDLPRIVDWMSRRHPAVRYRLLGTGGLFTTRREVLGHFSHQIRDRIEVVPAYSPEELPNLLEGGSVGVFPSYWEGFPFGVLEMLAAGLPVIAYEAPGPPEMIVNRYLVSLGDWNSMAKKAERLLMKEVRPGESQVNRAEEFKWIKAARETLKEYKKMRKKLLE